MIYALIIFSFLFESVITNIVPLNSFLVPLFFLTSLSILYPYFKSNNVSFIINCMVCGLIYDIAFGDSVFINTLSFGICGLSIICGYHFMKYTIYTSSFVNILSIVVYRIVSYFLLLILDYISFNMLSLFSGIYNSLLINLVYGIIIYLIMDLLAKIFNIKRNQKLK